MSLPELTFSKSWTAPASDSGHYLPTIEDSEEQAREDLQVEHDDTAAWALLLVTALKYASNLGELDDYSAIGTNIGSVKAALLSLKTQLDSISQGAIPDYSLLKSKLSRITDTGGAAVGTENIENGAITTAKLAAADSTTGTLAAVSSDNIRDGAVTKGKLSTGTGANAPVGPDNIQEEAIKTRHIDDAQITTAKLSSTSDSTGAAVGTANIQADAVTSAKLDSTSGSEAVTTDVIRDDAVTSAKLNSTSGSEAVTTDVIRDDAVTIDKLDATSVVTTVNGKVGAAVITKFKTASSVTFTEESTPTLTDYPYKATITDTDVTANDKVYVEFDATQINAGIYAPMTSSASGEFYIYAESAPADAQTISYTILKA